MKKTLFFLLALGCCCFAIVYGASNTPNAQSEDQLIGRWAEFWGNDEWVSDVDYVDTLKISIDLDGKYQMDCTNADEYEYDKIKRDGMKFYFRMENTSDPEEKFYVNYVMQLQEDGKELIGECMNSRDEENFVRMVKLE